ncbi:MAG: hypothetical protein GY782_01160 [Gammaproteobacteria bacterium]|nr:hypothetical protein [Gammaproteobacteria bacterium]
MGLCDDYLTVIETGWTSAVGTQPWVDIYANYLKNNYNGHPWDNTWRQAVAFAIDMMRTQITTMSQGIGGTWSPVAMVQFLTNCAGGGGASMADILTAMMSATFEELTEFMGITQAYKIAVWDAPFNEEFYAALAQGFRKWGP